MVYVPDSERHRVRALRDGRSDAARRWAGATYERAVGYPQALIVMAGLVVGTIFAFITPESMPLLMVGLTGAAAIAFFSDHAPPAQRKEDVPPAPTAELIEIKGATSART